MRLSYAMRLACTHTLACTGNSTGQHHTYKRSERIIGKLDWLKITRNDTRPSITSLVTHSFQLEEERDLGAYRDN